MMEGILQIIRVAVTATFFLTQISVRGTLIPERLIKRRLRLSKIRVLPQKSGNKQALNYLTGRHYPNLN
jgi:hypothetical protein